MFSKKMILTVAVCLFFVSNVSFAVICARLQSVSGGEYHTLALMDDNTLWACGSNSMWQLGLGSAVNQSYSLKQVKDESGNDYLENIEAFDAGWKHSLAADANGTLWAWGTDSEGQLGNGSNEGNWDVPQKVHGINDVNYLSDTVDVIYVSAGRSGKHSLAVDSNGYVYAWGDDGSGQCGDGSSGGYQQTPVFVLDDDPCTTDVYLGDIATIIQADAGISHSIALDDEGYVWHWGSGSDNGSYPEKVKKLSDGTVLTNIVQISSCGHSLAVDSNGFVWEWNNSSDRAYQVQDGEMDTTSGYLENIIEIGAGSGYSMARTSDGYVLVWNTGGSPAYVEDGEMDTTSGLLEDIISIGAGYSHRTAICENGYGWGWETNSSGQLGVGDTTIRDEPVKMWCAQASTSIYLTKTSEILGSEPNCARPFIGFGIDDNYLEFEISYGNPITNPSDSNYYGSVYDVNIVDHLPSEVDFYSVTGGGVYDSNTRTVTWTIGELAPGDSNSFTITTKVNNFARPGGEISNFAEMTADMYYTYATDTVSVCNWGSEIIYVDQDANGFDNGTSWIDAYTDLRDGFTGAQNMIGDITSIWVAEGIYKPVESIDVEDYDDYFFGLLEDVGLFGHFAGVGTYETSTSERDFSDSNNTTVLEGQIGESASYAVDDIVKAIDIDNAVIDGFTIQGAYGGSGIYLNSSDVSIVNCKFKNNRNYGIEATNYSYPDIHNCLFMGNTSRGIYSDVSQPDISYCTFDGNDTTSQGIYLINGSVSNISNSIILNYTGDGIYGSNATITVEDTVLSENNDNGIEVSNSDLTIGFTVFENNTDNGIKLSSYSDLDISKSVIRKSGEQGIYLSSNSGTSIVNSWIHNNGTDQISARAAGIYFLNQVGIPLVRNNTIYDNYSYGIESSENGADPNVLNCIIYGNDSNDFYRVNGSFGTVNYCNLQNAYAGVGNITGAPGFANIATDANDLHLSETSQCKDGGDPNGSYDESDIDGENRIYYGRVDIGADEYYWSAADIDENEFVDFSDYATFAKAWQSDSGDANYDEDCDLEDNNSIDVNDLQLFCNDWLWEKVGDEGWMMAMDSGGGSTLESMSMMMESSFLSVELPFVAPSVEESSDNLLLSATESIDSRPERLKAKSQKFYDITPATTISAKQQTLDVREVEFAEVNIKEILEWLDEIWLDGEFDETLTEKEYMEFRKSIEESLK